MGEEERRNKVLGRGGFCLKEEGRNRQLATDCCCFLFNFALIGQAVQKIGNF